MSLLLLTVTLKGVSNKHCLLSLFSFFVVFPHCLFFLSYLVIILNKLEVHILQLSSFLQLKVNHITSLIL